jgi:alpha-glucosidase
MYSIALGSNAVIEAARLGIIVDNVDLGNGAEAGKIDSYHLNESYAWRGVHSKATNRCNGARISVIHKESKTSYIIEVRVFDDGVAFRHVVADRGKPRVPDEASAFAIPAASSVW